MSFRSGGVALLVRLVVRLARRVLLLAGRVLLVAVVLAGRLVHPLLLLFARLWDRGAVGALCAAAPALLPPPAPAEFTSRPSSRFVSGQRCTAYSSCRQDSST